MPCKTDVAAARTIGTDTGKNTLHMIGLSQEGDNRSARKKISRNRIAARLVNVRPCLIGIEAGMASHHVARELLALGHEVKQVPPAYAKPFRQGHKNDFRDAHAIAGAEVGGLMLKTCAVRSLFQAKASNIKTRLRFC